jgi:hypothetical protein
MDSLTLRGCALRRELCRAHDYRSGFATAVKVRFLTYGKKQVPKKLKKHLDVFIAHSANDTY